MENNENNKDNLLSSEEIQALLAERESLKIKNSELETGLKNVVEEIKGLRKENSTLKDNPKQMNNTGELRQYSQEEIDERVRSILSESNRAAITAKRTELIEKFIRESKEFSPENDVAGLKRDAFKRKLGKFSLPLDASEDEVLETLKEASILVLNKRSNESFNNPVDINLTPNPADTFKNQSKTTLTDAEKAAMQRVQWDEKKFLEMKAKYPELIESIL